MKLSKLKLWNYRCFGSEEQVILIDQLTTFIGNNSAGKTAALSALNCMFSENSNDRILHRSDFHLPKDKSVQRASKDTCYQFQDGCCTEFERTRGKAMWHRYKR